MPGLGLIFIVVILVWRAVRDDFQRGFSLAVVLMIILPSHLRINLPGALPELTVQRLILFILFVHWVNLPEFRPANAGIFPLFPFLILVAVMKGFSTLFSVTQLPSLKDYLGFLLEVLLYSRIALSALVSHDNRLRMLRYLVGGLVFVALLSFLEKYRGINLAQRIAPLMAVDYAGAQGTFPHRILFGYAMAMGAAITIGLLAMERRKRQRRMLWIAFLLLASANYFSNSRGPWLGLGVGLVALLVLGNREIRWICMIFAVLVVVLLVMRPGVKQTFINRYSSTFNEDSADNKSYSYRWKLWSVAFGEICKSPDRFLIGYGGLSTESMDLGQYFDRQEGGTTARLGYTSWDNQYASDLIEYGMLGFVLIIALYLMVIKGLWTAWRAQAVNSSAETMLAGLMAAIVVYLFALSNVYIFSAQMRFLFWSLAICSLQNWMPASSGQPDGDQEDVKTA